MRAVIFDMDGVLVDSERQWKLAAADQLARLAPRWTEADSEAIVGLGVVELHDPACEAVGVRRRAPRKKNRPWWWPGTVWWWCV